MSERLKITPAHLARQAIVYLRQSSAAQVEHNRESTDRQYALAGKARVLGWPQERIVVIDEDLGLSGSGFPTLPFATPIIPHLPSSWGRVAKRPILRIGRCADHLPNLQTLSARKATNRVRFVGGRGGTSVTGSGHPPTGTASGSPDRDALFPATGSKT